MWKWPGCKSHLYAPWEHNGPPHVARKVRHPHKHQLEQGPHNFMGQFTTLLDYFSLGEFLSLAETQFASLRDLTMESWFCFQKHHRTTLLGTWCCSEVFKRIIMLSLPFPFSGSKNSHSFNHSYCDTFQMSSEFSFFLEFGPEILDLLTNS